MMAAAMSWVRPSGKRSSIAASDACEPLIAASNDACGPGRYAATPEMKTIEPPASNTDASYSLIGW
jgi:hypothetical protein